MAKGFRDYSLDQTYLLPQEPRQWLPKGHLALFLEEAVGMVDLKKITRRYRKGRGPRAYHPRMLLTVLLYGYCRGVYSSRKIASACESDVAFRVLSGGQFPDFRTVSDFRKNHLEAFEGLFLEVLRLCREAGLLKLGHLSLDGSKYQANASKHKAMSYGRILETGLRLETEVKEMLRRAQEIDEAEDEEFGPEYREDELPAELQRRESRLAKLREAKARLEERAKAKARAKGRAEARGASEAETEEAAAKAVPGPKEQSNFTDPDSRIMKSSHGWVQGYNAQVLVEEESGVIVAQEVSAQSADSPRLAPVLELMERNLASLGLLEGERRPQRFTADAGQRTGPGAIGWKEDRATGRERHYRERLRTRSGPRCGPSCSSTPEGHHRAGFRADQTGPGL